jgi:uncharacterized membrane protein
VRPDSCESPGFALRFELQWRRAHQLSERRSGIEEAADRAHLIEHGTGFGEIPARHPQPSQCQQDQRLLVGRGAGIRELQSGLEMRSRAGKIACFGLQSSQKPCAANSTSDCLAASDDKKRRTSAKKAAWLGTCPTWPSSVITPGSAGIPERAE